MRRVHKAIVRSFCVGMLVLTGSCRSLQDVSVPPGLSEQLPWSRPSLVSPPAFRWVNQTDSAWSMRYQGEIYRGRPTEVFAYYADPATLVGDTSTRHRYPGIILVHGGGGTAFRVWVLEWARRGYAALAMDLRGSEPLPLAAQNHAWGTKSRRLPQGGPEENQSTQFYRIDQPFSEQWPYHAVANVIRAHSLLRSFRQVNPARTGLTGISWGGYLTCLVAGIDRRFKAAVPVYGSGFLSTGSYWTTHGIFDTLGRENTRRWTQLWDPAQYIGHARMPLFFINGTNDFAYYAEAWDQSARLARDGRQLMLLRMKHSHEEGAAQEEISAFIEQCFSGKSRLPTLEKVAVTQQVLRGKIRRGTGVQDAFLTYATGKQLNTVRPWYTVPAQVSGDQVTVTVPDSASLYFLTVADQHNRKVSSRIFGYDR